MMRVRILSAVELELAASAHFYASRSRALARRFVLAVMHTIDAVRAHPHSGGILRDDVRRLLVPRFPFAILYRIDPDEILVVAIMDVRREPDYWIDRL